MTALWHRRPSEEPDANVESEDPMMADESDEARTQSDAAPEPEAVQGDSGPEVESSEPEPDGPPASTTRKMRWSLFGGTRSGQKDSGEAEPEPDPGPEAVPETEPEPEPAPDMVRPADAGADSSIGEDPEAPVSHARHGRRRKFGRAHRRTAAPARSLTLQAPTDRVGDVLLSVARRTGAVVLIAAVLMGALWGLALGINAFARWNARRVAAQAESDVSSENLLVIGVRDGVAIGFTALKVERDADRVLGIAIPEGAFVEVPGQGFDRIGASFDLGPAVSESAVSNYFGVQFPNYVAVDGDTYQALLQDQNIAAITSRIVSTDLTAAERESVSAFFKQVSAEDVWIVPLPVKAMTVGSERYFEPQREQVADLLLQWWGVRADQQKARTRVIVYDGVGTAGLASEAAQQLIRAGFQVVDSGSAERFGYEKTIILVYHAPTEAQAVRNALGVGVIQAQSAPQEITDMIVILGTDYLPPVSPPSNVPATPSSVATEGAR